MRRLLIVALVAVVGAAAVGVLRSRTAGVPRKPDALAQYEYARSTYVEPGLRARGSAREHLLRSAIPALQAVVRRFAAPRPPAADPAVTTRALAEYDTGLCYLTLGETDRAREAFLRVVDYRRFVERLPLAGKDTLRSLVDAAQSRIRDIELRSRQGP